VRRRHRQQPFEVIQEVNEDANSSFHNSTLHGMQGKGRNDRLKAGVSHTIRMMINQQAEAPVARTEDSNNNHFISSLADLMPTLDAVVTLRCLSRSFYSAMRVYLPARLQQQAWFINAFLDDNQYYNDQYLLLVHTQIPLSKGNWLTSREFGEVTCMLKTAIGRHEITNLRDFLRHSLRAEEHCLEPICRVLAIEPERKKLADGLVRKSYQRPLCKFLSAADSVEAVLRSVPRETIEERRFT